MTGSFACVSLTHHVYLTSASCEATRIVDPVTRAADVGSVAGRWTKQRVLCSVTCIQQWTSSISINGPPLAVSSERFRQRCSPAGHCRLQESQGTQTFAWEITEAAGAQSLHQPTELEMKGQGRHR